MNMNWAIELMDERAWVNWIVICLLAIGIRTVFITIKTYGIIEATRRFFVCIGSTIGKIVCMLAAVLCKIPMIGRLFVMFGSICRWVFTQIKKLLSGLLNVVINTVKRVITWAATSSQTK